MACEIVGIEAYEVSKHILSHLKKVFFGRRGRLRKDNLTDEVTLGNQSRVWLAPYPIFLTIYCYGEYLIERVP